MGVWMPLLSQKFRQTTIEDGKRIWLWIINSAKNQVFFLVLLFVEYIIPNYRACVPSGRVGWFRLSQTGDIQAFPELISM